jgi:hypothetical protein
MPAAEYVFAPLAHFGRCLKTGQDDEIHVACRKTEWETRVGMCQAECVLMRTCGKTAKETPGSDDYLAYSVARHWTLSMSSH